MVALSFTKMIMFRFGRAVKKKQVQTSYINSKSMENADYVVLYVQIMPVVVLIPATLHYTVHTDACIIVAGLYCYKSMLSDRQIN